MKRMKKFKKITSLVLVLMMLVTMIPGGLVTIHAEPAASVSIGSVAEWNSLAAQRLSFEGQTVSLSNDINANGATLNTLSPDFKGTFDGNFHTISNANVQGQALIATAMTGNATVQDLKLSAITLNAATADPTGMLVSSIASAGQISFISIVIDDASLVKGSGEVGGLIGRSMLSAETASISFEKILTEAEVSTRGNYAGGLIGYEASTAGDIELSLVAIISDVSSTTPSAAKANGLIGYFSGNSQRKVVIEMENVLIGGEIEDYVIYYQDYGEVNYHGLFITADADKDLIGAIRYDTWINNFRTKGLGLAGDDRGHVKLSTMIAYEIPQDDDPTDVEFEIPKAIENVDDVITLENGFLQTIRRKKGAVTVDFDNYDTQEVFTIQTFADWEAVAASGKDFAGKKLVLATNIDGWDEALPTLTDTFAGSFDGQGNTISNAKMTGRGTIANAISATSDIVIENLNLSRVVINSTANGGSLAGSLTASDADVTIRKVNVNGAVVGGQGVMGGLIGTTNVTTTAADGAVPVSFNIAQVSVRATVTGEASDKCVGGLIGEDLSRGNNENKAVTVNVDDCIVICTLTGGSKNCGLFGSVAGGNAQNPDGVLANATNYMYLNLNNIVIGGGVNYKILYGSNGTGNGVPVTINNIYLLDNTGNLFGFAKYGSWINGVISNNIAVSGERANITAESMEAQNVKAPLVVNEKAVGLMTVLDNNGFIKTVPDYVQAVAVQRSVTVGETYSIRFVAPSQFAADEISNVQMTVVASYKDAQGIMQTRTFSTASAKDEDGNSATSCIFYEFLVVYNQYGITSANLSANKMGAKLLTGFTIYNIPVDAVNIPEGITFVATMSYTNPLGQAVTSNAMTVKVDAAGNVVA